ncbi:MULTISPECIES: TolC family protein [Pelotomaculum]|uniref:TolC family protein n=1 Tax=Pelotomaculum isophthalicicum JI TaxID=947010 RepID=A0A9X4H5R5_9FIRM|nr:MULTISPECIES: TolC family protein [Pelotomaculum]MDF9409873.1 TolC family protein [Pelotomaculum isophthalicicum JI]OPX89031.1 MAG: outer membrane channel protein [Pelotomaculum sp. PtaB.Bin117]
MKKYLISIAIFLFAILVAMPALAADPAKPELTLNDAIARALANSNAVKKATVEIDRTKELRDDAADSIHFTPSTPPGDPATERAWANVVSADLTWRMTYKTLSVQQDSLALSTCKKYWGIQQAIATLDADKAALKQADLDLQKARAQRRVGLISDGDVITAESKYATAKSTADKAQNDLDNDYVAFNQTIGLNPQDRPVLTDELKLEPLEKNLDLDVVVSRAIDSSPSIWLATEKVKIQEYAKDSMFYTGSYNPYIAREDAVKQAIYDSMSAKDAAELLTRNLYYSIRSLEDNSPAAEQAVKKAEEDLRVANVKYQVGMNTRADVAAAESALVQAKKSLLDLKANHAYLKLAFQKPWAYSGGSSSGTD